LLGFCPKVNFTADTNQLERNAKDFFLETNKEIKDIFGDIGKFLTDSNKLKAY